ncbi:hypothetical protein RAHE111665_01860 [Rariglobus hedericola]
MSQPLLVEGRPLAGTEGMTLGDVELDVLKGGRFVRYYWNISVVVLSFRNSTALTYVRSDRSAGMGALGWGTVSLFFGWWGFPWGIVHTPLSLWHNTRGGSDHTHEVLKAYLGDDHSNEIIKQAPRRKADAALWILRGLVLSFVAMIAIFIYQVANA